MKTTINPAAAAVHFMKGERIAYTTPGQNKLAILREIKAGYPEGEPRYAFFYEDRSPGPDSGKFLHFSAAGSIRAALKAGRHVTVQELVLVAEVRESGAFVVETAPATPGLPLVPLGPNRTRDGREVRVICNDRKDIAEQTRIALYQVVGLMRNEGGCEVAGYWKADGTSIPGSEADDLVGHLPPEPVKLKELWSNGTLDVCIEKPADAEERGFRRYREVTPETEQELKDLRSWKETAMATLLKLDLQEVAEELDLPVGSSISGELLTKIKELKGRIPSGKQHQVWVRDSDGHVTSVLNDVEHLGTHGYRKALMMEVQP